MLKLLCCTAHPDDEAGGFGGSLLHYASQGVETHVICFTGGDAATHRGSAKSPEELVAMRELEFQEACRLLKVSHGTVLRYPDGKLDQQPVAMVVEDLVRRIREIRPHVIMTMGPEGAITAHPDHSMVSLFTTLAFHWAGRTNRFANQLKDGLSPHIAQKLYYSTTLFTMPDRQPVSQSPASLTIDLQPDELETKIAAFKCHVSQAPLFQYFEGMVRKRGRMELFHLAAGVKPQWMEQEKDIFAGVIP